MKESKHKCEGCGVEIIVGFPDSYPEAKPAQGRVLRVYCPDCAPEI